MFRFYSVVTQRRSTIFDANCGKWRLRVSEYLNYPHELCVSHSAAATTADRVGEGLCMSQDFCLKKNFFDLRPKPTSQHRIRARAHQNGSSSSGKEQYPIGKHGYKGIKLCAL